MKRMLVTICTLLVALSAPLAAEAIEGYLIDKSCSAKLAKEGVDAAKTHTKDCALMPNCKNSGYGVVTEDGKFLKLTSKATAWRLGCSGSMTIKTTSRLPSVASVLLRCRSKWATPFSAPAPGSDLVQT